VLIPFQFSVNASIEIKKITNLSSRDNLQSATFKIPADFKRVKRRDVPHIFESDKSMRILFDSIISF
jgi:hypothetical protein